MTCFMEKYLVFSVALSRSLNYFVCLFTMVMAYFYMVMDVASSIYHLTCEKVLLKFFFLKRLSKVDSLR